MRAVGYDRAGQWDLSRILDHVGEGLRTAVHGNDHQGPWIIRKLFGPIILKRIFRQRRWGYWTEVIQTVSSSLHELSRVKITAVAE